MLYVNEKIELIEKKRGEIAEHEKCLIELEETINSFKDDEKLAFSILRKLNLIFDTLGTGAKLRVRTEKLINHCKDPKNSIDELKDKKDPWEHFVLEKHNSSSSKIKVIDLSRSLINDIGYSNAVIAIEKIL